MSIGDESDKNVEITNETILNEIIPKEETVNEIELNEDIVSNEESKPQRSEKVTASTEPTRRSKRRINAPLRGLHYL